MFIRKNKNRSGSVSVQIISKKDGKYKVEKTVGSANKLEEIERLQLEAQIILRKLQHPSQSSLFLFPDEIASRNFLENLSNSHVQTIGPELIFGKIFDRLKFNQIKSELFRHIVIARLAYPTSKLKTVDYLYRYKGIKISVSNVYRFLDKLNEHYKEKVEQIAFEHTRKTLKGKISVAFYDMTTLYFEAEDEDDLRKTGFSKDGKFQHPQIMLGLLVGEKGLPIGYDIFSGNTSEGKTLLPTLEKIQKKYSFGKPIVIADAGLLSKKNIESLQFEKYEYIVGARIKNESNKIKQEILQKAVNLKNGAGFIVKKDENTNLVITYSDKRAKKDACNRKKRCGKIKETFKIKKTN